MGWRKHEAPRSLALLAAPALAGAVSSSDDAQCSQTVSVQPSSAYTLTGWFEGNYVYLGDAGTGTSDTDTWTPSAASWQQLSTSFSTGASTTSVTVYVHGWYAQGTYYADDLSLTGPRGSGVSTARGDRLVAIPGSPLLDAPGRDARAGRGDRLREVPDDPRHQVACHFPESG